MTKDNPLITVQDVDNGKTSIYVEGILNIRLSKKTADQLARIILFGPDA